MRSQHRVTREVERYARRGLDFCAVEIHRGGFGAETERVLPRGDIEVVYACVEAVVQGGEAICVCCEAGVVKIAHVSVALGIVGVGESVACVGEVAAGGDCGYGGLVVGFVDGADAVGVVESDFGVGGGLDVVVDAGVHEADCVDGDLHFGFGGAVERGEALVLLGEVVCVCRDVVTAVGFTPDADVVGL